MAADFLPTEGAKASAAMCLNMQVKRLPVIHKETFQLPAPIYYLKIIQM